MPSAARLRTQPSWSWLNSDGSSWGPLRGDSGWPVTSASPLTSTPSTTNEQCPPVWPGVGIAIGVPGRRAATSSVSACVVGMPSRVSAPLRADRHRPRQVARLPDVLGDVHRRRLLQILPLGVPDLGGVAVHRGAMGFREPDGRTEVVDVGMGQQDRAEVVDAEAELPQRVQHLVAAAGEPGVDQQDAVAVGDQRPVDEVGVGEVDAVGDGAQGRCHAASLCSGPLSGRVETNTWLN